MHNRFHLNRRHFMLAAAGAAVAGCSNAVGTNAAAQLDGRVEQTHQYLMQTYPSAAALIGQSRGVLYMPLMTEAAVGFGGAYGQGALRIDGQTVDYYSATRGSFGFQLGAQQYAHVLIFQTEPALAAFRAAPGWVAGAGAFYAVPDRGAAIGADTLGAQIPVVAMIFGQSGLMAGAAIEGTKYTRVIPSALGRF
ncbi:YSC84-related protein [Paracoccus sp. (in: a-proteobacteria)]|uniref:lipid-binding SYLF domain-containing protein n=1 Tax=Paracoccus sp. TaxID=267 RepID=UPI0026E0B4A5|nr:YSC84-related protein [Paracoccus sp. (in: a-proteobacteria)]MDO5646481.1 YSC84-related protein [Paracoccus sp. (in: a-proteobacteria)]